MKILNDRPLYLDGTIAPTAINHEFYEKFIH